MPVLDRPGIFRATITDYSLDEAKSGAVALACKFDLYQKLEANGEWRDWNYDQHIYGNTWLIKKDGTLNDKAQQAFMKASGWDGELESILDKSFHPWPVQIDVREEDYQGKTKFVVAFVNHHDDEGGGGGLRAMDDAKAKSLVAKFSSQFRASASQVGDRPAPPPPAPATGEVGPDGVPF